MATKKSAAKKAAVVIGLAEIVAAGAELIEKSAQGRIGGRLPQAPVANQQQQRLGGGIVLHHGGTSDGNLQANGTQQIEVDPRAAEHRAISYQQPVSTDPEGLLDSRKKFGTRFLDAANDVADKPWRRSQTAREFRLAYCQVKNGERKAGAETIKAVRDGRWSFLITHTL